MRRARLLASIAVALACGGVLMAQGDARCRPAAGMAEIPAGAAMIGEDGAGHPGRPVRIAAFRIDRTEVTNAAFAAFVAATGYRTDAERQGGAAVFVAPRRLDRGIDDPGQWWKWMRGASWRHPQGPGSDLAGHEADPVVQVTFADAAAYARWRRGSLPGEDQWERAARGGRTGLRAPSAWAVDEAGRPAANVWQGIFPLFDRKADGFAGLAPVGCFRPNAFGLYDMIGNAWEWTRDASGGPAALRGGSFLCSEGYCANYRPAGRQVQEAGLATSHAGFRIVGDRNTRPMF